LDYKTGTTVSSALSYASGSPNLLPESATTYSGGIVLTPHWVPGLTMSFDWYSISLKGVISSPSTTNERAFCLAGTLTPTGGSYCANWVYNPALVSGSNVNGLQFVY